MAKRLALLLATTLGGREHSTDIRSKAGRYIWDLIRSTPAIAVFPTYNPIYPVSDPDTEQVCAFGAGEARVLAVCTRVCLRRCYDGGSLQGGFGGEAPSPIGGIKDDPR